MKHILLVDDENYFRFSAAVVLARAGYRIKETGSGEEALELLLEKQKTKDPFNLLIADIVMPGMSGIELIDEINKNNISIMTLIVTGHAENELVSKLVRRGCSNILFKPFEPHEMLKQIKAILEESSLC